MHVQDPVCTPDGFLFSKEAIIENLVQQKKAIKRKLAAWEAQQSDDQLKVINVLTHAEHKLCMQVCCSISLVQYLCLPVSNSVQQTDATGDHSYCHVQQSIMQSFFAFGCGCHSRLDCRKCICRHFCSSPYIYMPDTMSLIAIA